MITGMIGQRRINCLDGEHSDETLRAWSKKGIIKCDACGGVYEYCHGRIVTPYFRHLAKNDCQALYYEPETEEHLQGKKKLYDWLLTLDNVSDVVLEDWIPETKQKPDLSFVMDGEKCVIEYQCTPIASEYLKRHELYEAAGIRDFWVCGIEKYNICITEDQIMIYGSKTMQQHCIGYYNSANDVYIHSGGIINHIAGGFAFHTYRHPLAELVINNRGFYCEKDAATAIKKMDKLAERQANKQQTEDIAAHKALMIFQDCQHKLVNRFLEYSDGRSHKYLGRVKYKRLYFLLYKKKIDVCTSVDGIDFEEFTTLKVDFEDHDAVVSEIVHFCKNNEKTAYRGW